MKKVGLCSLALASVLTLSGCKGTTNDVEKQIEKMETVVKEGKIFEEDYAIITKDESGEETNVLIVDDNKVYMVSEKTKIWLEKGRQKTTIYLEKGNEKKYIELDNDEYEEIEEFLEFETYVLEEEYKDYVKILKETLDECNDKDVTCTVKKSLLGKVTFTIDEDYRVGTIVLKGGKVLSLLSKGENYESLTEYEYGNQTVEMPDKDDFDKVTDFFDFFI